MTPTKKTKAEGEEKKPAKKASAKKAAAPKKVVAAAAPVAVEVAPSDVAEEPSVVRASAKVGLTVADFNAAESKSLRADEFIYAIGRRKTAVAKTKLWTGGKGEIKVNGRDYKAYFPVYQLQETLIDALRTVGQDGKVTIEIETMGGGQRGQAEAARLGISRALIELNPTYRKSLKQLGYLMRDPREKERKKFGLKKARKAPQWAKR